ncbi:MAG: ATP-binding protein [Clostridia bacterium]|nr:ATP-binding protein [Clostridia bacterium]
MMENERTIKPIKRRHVRRFKRRKKMKSTSIYFLLWTVFTALSLFIVLFSSVMQRIIFVRSYKEEAARKVSEKGKLIEQILRSNQLPSWAGGNYSGYLRFLAQSYDVRLYLLSGTGEVLFPQEQNFDPSAPEISDKRDFSDKIELLLQKLNEADGKSALYETEHEYVYAAKLVVPGSERYLYVGSSLELMETAVASMSVRMWLVSVFVFALSFAITSAVAGILTKPISEITKKAGALGRGDFDVDFYGADYCKELAELAKTLNFARDELSKTDQMQKELIANISHDFKTPLTMIKAYASMIMEISGDIPEKRNKHALIIVDEADRLSSLVGDVLDLSKISSGIAGLDESTFNMSAYTRQMLDRFTYLRDTAGYRFITDIDEGLFTRADKGKIGQVLYNLISNAVNYTGADKTVYIRLKKESENTFRFSVTDTGKGIKKEELSTIWDRYYRSKEVHKRPVRGTGLGLSIVKTILQRHNLTFGVESEEGKGSTFYAVFQIYSEV